jgi:hypothetical protein
MLTLNACSMGVPAATSTPAATETATASPTLTSTPTKTPLPTRTPNLAATQQYQEWEAEIQGYFDKGYIDTADGTIKKLDGFSEAWAQIDWYSTWYLDETAENFVFSAHYEWSSSSKTPNISGCGLVFGIQNDNSDFSVFLDKSQILFLRSEFGHGFRVGKTRGTGTVKIAEPTEADFTLIVYDYYAYVIVNGEVVGEYTLPQSQKIEGDLGVSILSGTNKGYGTRCEMTDMRLWTPNK